jgi:hypothetical protein
MNLEFSRHIPKKYNLKFHENPYSGSRVVPCGWTGQTDRRRDKRTDMTKLIVSFRNFSNATINALCEFCMRLFSRRFMCELYRFWSHWILLVNVYNFQNFCWYYRYLQFRFRLFLCILSRKLVQIVYTATVFSMLHRQLINIVEIHYFVSCLVSVPLSLPAVISIHHSDFLWF